MRRFLFVLAILALTTATAFGQTFGAVLTGSQETPPNNGAGFGNATVTFDSTQQNINVTITVANLGAAINNFHIHEGPPGVAGNVRVDLIGQGGQFNNGTMTGTFSIAPDVAGRLLSNPGNFYVNVHTTQFPGGAVRGQLACISGCFTNYAADLRGANEVPPTGSSAFGSAFLTFDFVNNLIGWEVNSSGIANASLSHIHRGAAGVAGPVIINFATSASQIAGGRTSGFATIASQQANAFLASDLPALANATTANNYYVNLHSSAFPTGEIRGQIVPANEYEVPIAGKVTNGLLQTFVTDVRIFNPSYTNATTAMIEFFPVGAPFTGTATTSTVVNVPARGTAVLDDVSSALKLTGIGGLRVSSAAPLSVSSRVFNDLRASNKGTLGEFVPAQARSAALRRGVIPQLSNHSDLSSGLRTNIGFFNPNMQFVAVRLELRDSSGALLGQNTLTLPPLSQQQNAIGSYFPSTVDLSNVANVTLSFDAAAPIFAYGAVNDNVSGDAGYIAAQSDSGLAANSQ